MQQIISGIDSTSSTASAVHTPFFHIVRFHKPEEENGYMSNWYMRDFTLDEKRYCCVEQYMMERKALIFEDFQVADQIMLTKDPQRMQELGRSAKNFVPVIWNGRKQLVVFTGLMAKFEQNPDLLGRLVATGTATPVECSRSDRIWGIGMGVDDPDAANPTKWNGQNLLGFALQAVRAEFIKEILARHTEAKHDNN